MGLLLFVGCMLVIMAIPFVFVVAYVVHSDPRSGFYSDWHWAFIVGAVMAGAMALIGFAFLGVVRFIEKRRIKSLGYREDENDA